MHRLAPLGQGVIPVTIVAAGAALATARAQPIKIGEVNSYKVQPAFLEPYKKGMELAIEEINAAGGINTSFEQGALMVMLNHGITTGALFMLVGAKSRVLSVVPQRRSLESIFMEASREAQT